MSSDEHRHYLVVAAFYIGTMGITFLIVSGFLLYALIDGQIF